MDIQDWKTTLPGMLGWPVLLDLAERLLAEGDVRGGLLRWAHQLAHGELTTEAGLDLQHRMANTLQAYHDIWEAELPPVPDGLQLQWQYGFVTGVVAEPTQESMAFVRDLLAADSGRLCHRLDVVRPTPEALQELLPGLMLTPWSYGLHLCLVRAFENVAKVFAGQTLPGVQTLEFRSSRIGQVGAQALASAYFPALERLALSGNGLSDAGVVALQSSSGFPRLQQLDVRNNGMWDVAALRGREGPGFRALTHLYMGGNAITGRGLQAVLDGVGPGLMELELGDNPLGGYGAAVIARGQLSHLVHLELRETHLGTQGVGALSRAKPFSALQWLDLAHNPLGASGFKELMASPSFPALRWLDLSRCELPDDAMYAMPKWTMPSLERLLLRGNRLTSRGIAALSAHTKPEPLNHIELAENAGMTRRACA